MNPRKKRLIFEKIDWDYSKHIDLWQVTIEDIEEDNGEKLGVRIATKLLKIIDKMLEILKK